MADYAMNKLHFFAYSVPLLSLLHLSPVVLFILSMAELVFFKKVLETSHGGYSAIFGERKQNSFPYYYSFFLYQYFFDQRTPSY